MGQKNSSLNSMVLSNLKMVDSLSELESSVTSFVESEKGKSTLNHSSSLSKERLSNGKKKLNYIYIQNENLPNISIENDEFNELDKKILILSYASIKADFDQVGLISFMKSFETLPAIQDKFESFKGLPFDELSTNHALRTHSNKVMRIVAQIIEALEDEKLEIMKEKLIQLGERHFIYGVIKQEYFTVIEFQFLKAIEPIMLKNLAQKRNFLADFFDHGHKYLNSSEILSPVEIEKAMILIRISWHKVFAMITRCMNEGIDHMNVNSA